MKCCFCQKNVQKASFYPYIHRLNSQCLKKWHFFCFNFEMICIYGVFEMMCLYGVFCIIFGYMTTGAYWSLQTTCTYGDFVRFFKLNDNSGFSTCFFFQIILFEIFIKILPKLSWHMVFLMKYLSLLNRIIRWQKKPFSRLFCTMVISNAFFVDFPLWQKGHKKILLSEFLRVFLSSKID